MMDRNRYTYQRLNVRTEQSIQLVLKESRTPQPLTASCTQGPLPNVSGKGAKKGNFSLETLNRHYLGQMIKVDSKGEVMSIIYSLIRGDNEGTLPL